MLKFLFWVWRFFVSKISSSTNIDNIQFNEQASAAATPASGFRRLYAKSDGIYEIDSAGIELKLAAESSVAPIDATYIVDSADATLTNEITLATALATSPTIGATTPPDIFAGSFLSSGSTANINSGFGDHIFTVKRNSANDLLYVRASATGNLEGVAIGASDASTAILTVDGAQQLSSEKPLVIFNNRGSWTTNNVLELQDGGSDIRVWDNSGYDKLLADATTDVAPVDDTTMKKLTVQRLSADPTNAAFIKLTNSPGTPTNDFYLILEEG
jgi:hypothetical protein